MLCGEKEAYPQRSQTVGLHLYEISRGGKSLEIECRPVVTRGWGQEQGVTAAPGQSPSGGMKCPETR